MGFGGGGEICLLDECVPHLDGGPVGVVARRHVVAAGVAIWWCYVRLQTFQQQREASRMLAEVAAPPHTQSCQPRTCASLLIEYASENALQFGVQLRAVTVGKIDKQTRYGRWSRTAEAARFTPESRGVGRRMSQASPTTTDSQSASICSTWVRILSADHTSLLLYTWHTADSMLHAQAGRPMATATTTSPSTPSPNPPPPPPPYCQPPPPEAP